MYDHIQVQVRNRLWLYVMNIHVCAKYNIAIVLMQNIHYY